jgi:hypothetical protein
VSLRRILVLLVLVAALGAYLWVWELPQAEREGSKERLVAVDKDAVTGLTLVYPDREIELRRDDTAWRLVRPVEAPADEAAVKALLTTVVDAEIQRTLEELPQDLADFGLDTPSATVRLSLHDGSQPPPIVVGKNTKIGGRTYVRRGEEPKVHLTASTLQFGVNKQVKDLRDKQLLAFEDDAVTRLEIHPAASEPTTLLRGGDAPGGAWTIEPGGHPADPSEVRSYLSSLRATRAVDFPDDAPTDLARYGLDAPRLTVTVATGKDGEQAQTLVLGAEATEGTEKRVYAKRADRSTVYALGDWSFRTLNKERRQFRDKAVLAFEDAAAGRIVLEREDGEGTTLTRGEDGSWRVADLDAGKTMKADAASRFVEDLRELRGSDIAAEPAGDLAAFGLDTPDIRIAVNDREGAPIGTLLAARHAGKHYAMRAGAETVFEVRDYMYTRLDKRERDFVTDPTAPGASAPRAEESDDAEDLEDEDLGDDETE